VKIKKSQLKELIKQTIVDLTEKTFGSKAQYDAYRKKHNLKPGSKHKVAGKTVTVRDTKKISKSAKKKADKFAAAQNAKLDAAEKAAKKKKKSTYTHKGDDKLVSLKVRKESVSKSRRYTVKEVRTWMKKLEENRYKKVYNSDARRVAWMVNNEGVELSEMPQSMSKKWTKAQYGRERYLATEFLKSKSEQMTEGKLTEAISGADRKILFILVREIVRNLKSQIKNMDVNNKSHLNRVGSSILAIIRAMSYSPDNVNYKNFKKYFPKNFNSKLIQKKLKQFHSQNDKVQVTLVTQAIKNELGEGKLKEAYRSQSIFFDKKDKSKLEKLLKKHKGKFPFNPSGESVVNWSLNDKGSKGLEWSGIPKANYNKAVEFFMKYKLNPRG
jgi:hypothetical protein